MDSVFFFFAVERRIFSDLSCCSKFFFFFVCVFLFLRRIPEYTVLLFCIACKGGGGDIELGSSRNWL